MKLWLAEANEKKECIISNVYFVLRKFLVFAFCLKGTLMQIWKSVDIFVFTWKWYDKDLKL